jgi:uncharacterized protein (TIGR00661 family)
MKYFFIVQGEGMGHTTQSLALRSILERNGHIVTTTFLGTNFNGRKNVLYQNLPYQSFFSPVFLHRSDKQGINLFRTFLYNILLSPIYFYAIVRIAWHIRISDARVIIVFYDMIGQLGSYLAFSGKPVYSISHHFFFDHPSFKWPLNRKAERLMLKFHSALASLGSRKKLAISFTEENNIVASKLFVIPPLLRPEILQCRPKWEEFVHIYCLQPGFLNDIVNLAIQTPKMEFRVFVHEFGKSPELPSNLYISLIKDDKFRESIRNSCLVICTAGFETLAEAVYLNKPVIVIPSKGHFEQYCNAIDAERAGIAAISDSFDGVDFPGLKNNPAHVPFVKWVAKAEEIIINSISD